MVNVTGTPSNRIHPNAVFVNLESIQAEDKAWADSVKTINEIMELRVKEKALKAEIAATPTRSSLDMSI